MVVVFLHFFLDKSFNGSMPLVNITEFLDVINSAQDIKTTLLLEIRNTSGTHSKHTFQENFDE